MTRPVTDLRLDLGQDRRFRRRRRALLLALSASALLVLVAAVSGVLLRSALGSLAVLILALPLVVWSAVERQRLGGNWRQRFVIVPSQFVVRSDGVIGFEYPGRVEPGNLRGAHELVFASTGTVSGSGDQDGFDTGIARYRFDNLWGGELGRIPEELWAPAEDGPALWLCFRDEDWLVCGPRVGEAAAALAALGPVPWPHAGGRPPGPAPTALRTGTFTPGAAPAPRALPEPADELVFPVAALSGWSEVVLDRGGRTVALRAAGVDPHVRGVAELVGVDVGLVEGSMGAGGARVRGLFVGVADGPSVRLCFADEEWLLGGLDVQGLAAALGDLGPLPAVEPGSRPAALRHGTWSPLT